MNVIESQVEYDKKTGEPKGALVKYLKKEGEHGHARSPKIENSNRRLRQELNDAVKNNADKGLEWYQIDVDFDTGDLGTTWRPSNKPS